VDQVAEVGHDHRGGFPDPDLVEQLCLAEADRRRASRFVRAPVRVAAPAR